MSELSLLMVDDSDDYANLVASSLRKDGPKVRWERVDSLPALSSAFDRVGWDLIIADYSMPACPGSDVLKMWRHKDLDVPVIAVCASGGEELAVEAMNLGAHDYVEKSHLVRLGAAVRREIQEAETRRRRRQAEYALVVYAYREAAIARLGRQALLGGSVAELMRDAAEKVHATLAVDYTKIMMPDQGGGQFVLREGVGWREGVVGSAAVPASIGSPAGYTVLTNSPVVTWDIAHEKRFGIPPLLTEHGVVCGVIVPISGASSVYGVLGADSRSARVFSRNETDFLQSIANILATAIDRSSAEEALRRSEAKYRSLFAFAPVGICQSTPDGKLLNANTKMADILGFDSVEELKRIPALDVHFDLDERATFAQKLEHYGAVSGERRLKRKDGSEVWVESSTRAERNPSGETMYYEAFVQDVTQRHHSDQSRRDAEAQLQRVNRIESLGRVAATMAHEFNNVLMGIQPFAEILGRQLSGNAQAQQAVQRITASIKRGKRVTEEILRFTRRTEPVIKPVALREWIDLITTEARAVLGPRIEFRTEVEEELSILADGQQLHQVFMNMIVNARDAINGHGSITLSIGRHTPTEKYSFTIAESDSELVHFRLTDTGCGISPETLRKIFEPLFTTKISGTGIGLSLAHQVIREHRGQIFVESASGRGTTFHVFLPLAKHAVLNSGKTYEADDEMSLHRVLIVEDDEAVATGLKAVLQSQGIMVELCATGGAAVDCIRRTHPDAVILDMGLPDMDGSQVFLDIHQYWPELPVVFSTANADASRLQDYLACETVTFLPKPYESAALLDSLRRVGRARFSKKEHV